MVASFAAKPIIFIQLKSPFLAIFFLPQSCSLFAQIASNVNMNAWGTLAQVTTLL
jgi:hypothetical protein